MEEPVDSQARCFLGRPNSEGIAEPKASGEQEGESRYPEKQGEPFEFLTYFYGQDYTPTSQTHRCPKKNNQVLTRKEESSVDGWFSVHVDVPMSESLSPLEEDSEKEDRQQCHYERLNHGSFP
jgi:hypothetical protein